MLMVDKSDQLFLLFFGARAPENIISDSKKWGRIPLPKKYIPNEDLAQGTPKMGSTNKPKNVTGETSK